MELIPAIDLLDGKCVRLKQGDYSQVTEFNSNPIDQALLWQEMGAKRIHLVDLDAAKTGDPHNNRVIKNISSSIEIPIQMGGGIRTIERAEELLGYGIDRIIVGTMAIEQQGKVEVLAKNYPNKVIVGIDAKEGKVATRGWLKESNTDAAYLAKKLSKLNLAAIISTDIATDGTLEGPNIDSLRAISSASNVPIIASGGIGSIADILSIMPLENYGVTGIIVGRALYEGKVDLREALKSIKSPLINDYSDKKSFYA